MTTRTAPRVRRYTPAQIESMIRGEVRRQGGDPNGPVANAVVATAKQESKLDPRAVGDDGESFGLFQYNVNGALGNRSKQWAFNPMNQIRERVRLFLDGGVTTGAGAAKIQRPFDPRGYAREVDAKIGRTSSSSANGPGNSYLTLGAWLKRTFGVKFDNPDLDDPNNPQTIGGRHAPDGNHPKKLAVDVGDAKNDRAKLNRIASYAKRNPGQFSELYFNPLGWGIKDGKIVKGLTVDGHDDHMHLAVFANGGSSTLEQATWYDPRDWVDGAGDAIGGAWSGAGDLVESAGTKALHVGLEAGVTLLLVVLGLALVLIGTLKATGMLGTAKQAATMAVTKKVAA